MIKISPIDYELLREEWKINDRGYATRSRYKSFPDSPRLMHRLIMERILGKKLMPKDICDHINGDKIDNRRENLRIVDAVGNAQNRPYPKTRGSSWVKDMNKWLSRVTHKGKRIDLGYYDNREDAISVAEQKRQELKFLERAYVDPTEPSKAHLVAKESP